MRPVQEAAWGLLWACSGAATCNSVNLAGSVSAAPRESPLELGHVVGLQARFDSAIQGTGWAEGLLPAGAILGTLHIFLFCPSSKSTRLPCHKGGSFVCFTDCCVPCAQGSAGHIVGAQ